MGVDASVIAQIGQNTPDITGSEAKAYTLADMIDRNQLNKMTLNAERSKQSDAAQVKKILQSADLSTYEGKVKAGEAITKVSPEMGMNFLRETNQGRQQQQQYTAGQYELMAAKNDVIGNAALELKTQHDTLVRQGVPEAQVNAMMMPKLIDTLKALEAAKLPDGTPVLNDQDRANYEQALGKGYNVGAIDSIVTRSQQARQALASQVAARKEDTAEATEAERERHDRATEANAAAKTAGGQYTDDQRDLLAALAVRNVSLPAGLRSQAQIKATIDGLLNKEKGKSPDEIADDIVSGKLKLSAETKAAQVAGGQIGKVALAANELDTFGDQVLTASKDMPRGQSITINGLLQMGEKQLSDPKLLTLKAKLTALNNAYDQLAARGGTDQDKRAHIHELFDARLSEEGVQALVKAVKEEAEGARTAANRTMAESSQAAIPGAQAPGAAPGVQPTAGGAPGAAPAGGGGGMPPPPPGFQIVGQR